MTVDPQPVDRQALILLCSGVSGRAGSVAPLGPAGWAKVKARLDSLEVGPGALLGLSSGDMTSRFGFDDEQSDRMVALLDRAGPMTVELERLANLGIWAMTAVDAAYPPNLANRLGTKAPPVLFCAGEGSLPGSGGLAIVGSRDVDDEAVEFTAAVARAAARGGVSVISGAARGIDSAAMNGALESGGPVVGVLADSLARRIRDPQVRMWLADGQLCLLSPYGPDAGFSTGAAMGRNKIVYALSDATLVVSASEGSGGTWAGATEALKAGWTTVLVRTGSGAPAANGRLIERGALGFPDEIPEELTRDDILAMKPQDMEASEQSTDPEDGPVQETLFEDLPPAEKPPRHKGSGRTRT